MFERKHVFFMGAAGAVQSRTVWLRRENGVVEVEVEVEVGTREFGVVVHERPHAA